MTPLDRLIRLCGRCGAALSFAAALAVYLLTVEPGASYWDCPEYVVTATAMEVGHPPGNPVWTLAMRMATILAPAGMEALAINICSGIFTALAAALLYLVIFAAWRRLFPTATRTTTITGALSSLGGALAFAWCDSVWFSAVEAEVYAMSIFLTVLMLWLMTLWARCPDSGRGDRLLVLTAYITGLSLGVHQLNLLVLPVLALMWVYVRFPVTTRRGIVLRKGMLAVALSFVVIAFVLGALMPGLLAGAAAMELFAVNTLSLPYYSGVLIFLFLLLAAFIVAVALIRRRWASMTVWMLAMVCLGYSSFAVVMIRAAALPPMNEGAPGDIFSLASYIARDQYGSRPLLHGRTPYSKPLVEERFQAGDSVPDYSRYHLLKGKPTFVRTHPGAALGPRSGMLSNEDSSSNMAVTERGHGYLLADYTFSNTYAPELDMWFPRLTSSSPSDLEAYGSWTGMDRDNMVSVEASTAVDTTGRAVGKIGIDGKRHKTKAMRPTYLQNLQYFLGYQVYYMYFRYLLWNFCGRQNDVNSSGEVEHGNFITGIIPVDNLMLGAEDKLPSELGSANRGRNAYYALPLLLGIVGIIWLCRQGRAGRRICTLVLLLFLMTGVAIVVYLNQTPCEPRERDYSFLGSYMAFAMWIAFGIGGIARWAGRYIDRTSAAASEPHDRGARTSWIAVLLLGVPVLMLAVNYDDHDRSGRHAVDDFSRNVLESMPPEAILFVEGDNFTFPLWYAQETLGVRPDVTVVNCSYLALPSYRVTLMQEGRGSRPLRSQSRPADILYGKYAYTRIAADADTTAVPLSAALRELFSDSVPLLRHSRVSIASAYGDSTVIDLRRLLSSLGRSSLPFAQLAALDIIGSNASVTDSPRPVVFRIGVPSKIRRPVEGELRDMLHGSVYWPQTSDSLLADWVYGKAMGMRDGGFGYRADGDYPYCDPTIDHQLRRQRAAMMMGAATLLKEGHAHRAREVAEKGLTMFPGDVAPFRHYSYRDTVRHESKEYPRLLRAIADSLGGKESQELYRKAAEIEEAARRREQEYRRYRRALPPRLRAVMSY